MPIKSKVFIQIVQKSQNRHEISFAIEFNNKNTKKVFVIEFFGRGRFPPPPNTIKLNLPPNAIRVNFLEQSLYE